jgi:hypothetical protein
MIRLVSMGTILKVKASGASSFSQISDVKKFPSFMGSAEMVDTSCIEDVMKTSAPGQSDPGDMEFTHAYTGMAAGTNWDTLRALQIADEAADFQCIFPDGSGFQWNAKVALSMGEVGDGNSPLEFTCKHFPTGEILPLSEVVATPTITTNLPNVDSVTAGSNKTLTVVASAADSGSLTYLWYKNHIALPEVAASLTITTAESSDAGAYKCVITNTKNGAYASIESNVCQLNVN